MPEHVTIDKTYRYFSIQHPCTDNKYDFRVEKRKALIQLVEDLEPYIRLEVAYNETLKSHMISASITVVDDRDKYKEN